MQLRLGSPGCDSSQLCDLVVPKALDIVQYQHRTSAFSALQKQAHRADQQAEILIRVEVARVGYDPCVGRQTEFSARRESVTALSGIIHRGRYYRQS